MVSAKGAEIDAVVGLEVGADDYIVKPYRLRELVARLRAALRRGELSKSDDEAAGVGTVAIGAVSIDPEQHVVVIRGEVTKLPLKEFELLYILMANAGRVMTRDTLIDRVWGLTISVTPKHLMFTSNVCARRLRKSLQNHSW